MLKSLSSTLHAQAAIGASPTVASCEVRTKIVYVSCNPEHWLAISSYYNWTRLWVLEATPVDMFVATMHVEVHSVDTKEWNRKNPALQAFCICRRWRWRTKKITELYWCEWLYYYGLLECKECLESESYYMMRWIIKILFPIKHCCVFTAFLTFLLVYEQWYYIYWCLCCRCRGCIIVKIFQLA